MEAKRFLIKVCGVTRPEDAELCARAGAGAIGVNFWHGSRRFVEESRAREVLAAVPAGVLKVGLFVNAHPLVVSETFHDMRLDRVQLHGDEKVGDFSELGPGRVIRALRVHDENSIKEGAAWNVDLFICDAYVERTFGGTGELAPWELIARAAPRPFLLAGGLTPDNVAAGIRATRPNGVDVSSGTEAEPGRKDPDKVRRFIDTALGAARALGLDTGS